MERLNELSTLHYKKSGDMVSIGDKDEIKISICANEKENPHFNIVKNKQMMRISLETLEPLNDHPKWHELMTAEQYENIIFWAATNKNKLIKIYNDAKNGNATEDTFVCNFSTLHDSIDILPSRCDSDIEIKSAELVSDNHLLVNFVCDLSKIVDLSIYWDKDIYKQLKDKNVRENFVVYNHMVWFNDDTDISAMNLWLDGVLVED